MTRRRRRFSRPNGRDAPGRSRILTWWFGLTALGGLAFGLFAEERPFGTGVLSHPAIVLFAAIAAGLLVLRTAAAQPVQEIIPDRALVVGCFVAAAAFLLGNLAGVHLASR